MKFPHSPRGGRLITGMLALMCMMSQSFAETEIPRGTLNVDRSVVRAGMRSQLDWRIEYPTRITDIVEVGPTGTITPKAPLKMKVRTLGVAFQSGSKLLPVEAYWAKNNSSFTRFFSGTATSVVPTRVLVDTTVNQGEKINFAGRGYSGSSWFPTRSTRVTDPYVVVLKNGDSAPKHAPAYNQASAETFLAPYLDAGGRIRIGPRDLIILWEASTAAPGTTYFDMQDIVVLVTFE